MIVCKFGGTSVGDAEAIARTATIIAARRERQPVVVVSALAAGNHADAPHVCVSSAAASFGGGDEVVETKDVIDCG